jgi:threonine/homoserine/homoserine lactone efflux protein
MYPILYGAIVGLFLAVLTGPVFFKLVQTSINHGFSKGIYFALGVSTSDAIYALLAFFGLSTLLENESFVFWMGKIGGTVLIIFGAVSIWKAIKASDIPAMNPRRSWFKGNFYLQGITINFLSPAVIFYWMGIIAVGRLQFSIQEEDIPFFLMGTLITILTMDTLKSYLSDRLRTYLTDRILTRLNFLIGILLIGFGIRMLFLKMSDINPEGVFQV